MLCVSNYLIVNEIVDEMSGGVKSPVFIRQYGRKDVLFMAKPVLILVFYGVQGYNLARSWERLLVSLRAMNIFGVGLVPIFCFRKAWVYEPASNTCSRVN